ncbi:FxLD family lanthipeptide [Sinosporangium siamense]|uniref:FxLD family lantipeptide n=1 Tax=Sinosporangium siamense TaxID=1367973 RepID=A0A919REJ4_9ACTN|nr:FxLD family lanthipeptide [Sinosporangium siamense]GII91355.1 hypothetical protein Ssi02_15860 [Sinosporangium siamense]
MALAGVSTMIVTPVGVDQNAETDFALDLTFVTDGPVVAELMNSTSDGCTSTGASACVTCVIS